MCYLCSTLAFSPAVDVRAQMEPLHDVFVDVNVCGLLCHMVFAYSTCIQTYKATVLTGTASCKVGTQQILAKYYKVLPNCPVCKVWFTMGEGHISTRKLHLADVFHLLNEHYSPTNSFPMAATFHLEP